MIDAEFDAQDLRFLQGGDERGQVEIGAPHVRYQAELEARALGGGEPLPGGQSGRGGSKQSGQKSAAFEVDHGEIGWYVQ
jgi:hypothetical protein